MAEISIISWDSEGIDIDALDEAVYNASATGRPVRITEVDTGCQAFAIAISRGDLVPLPGEIWDAWNRHAEEVGW